MKQISVILSYSLIIDIEYQSCHVITIFRVRRQHLHQLITQLPDELELHYKKNINNRINIAMIYTVSNVRPNLTEKQEIRQDRF